MSDDATIQIPLTRAQVDSAQWLMGCPLFQNNDDAESLAHQWDETLERAAVIVAAAKLASVNGRVLTLPVNRDVIDYVHGYAEQLASMSAHEYRDELLSNGTSFCVAQCKVNAAVRSAEALAAKIGGYL